MNNTKRIIFGVAMMTFGLRAAAKKEDLKNKEKKVLSVGVRGDPDGCRKGARDP